MAPIDAGVMVRLFCPPSWDDTTVADPGSDPEKVAEIRRRRDRAGIGDEVRHREKWRLALDMLDEMILDWGLPRLPVAADSDYGDCTMFRLGVAEHGLYYAVQVDPNATAYPADAAPVTPAYTGRGRPPKPAYPDPPATFKALVLAAGRAAARPVTWRRGSRRTKTNPTAAMRSHFVRLRIRPANRDIPRAADGTLPEEWLLAEWPPDTDEPVKYWLSNMDTPTSLLAWRGRGGNALRHMRFTLPPRIVRTPGISGIPQVRLVTVIFQFTGGFPSE